MKVYIAGPMTGLPNYNYDAFHFAAEAWRAEGWEVLNPAEHFDGDQTLPRATYLRKAMETVLEADAIATLPGWLTSAGARLEMAMAVELALLQYDALEPQPVPG